jgi:hypothetical protein
MSAAFLVVAILSALWGVVDAILIAVAHDKRGIQVNMILFPRFSIRCLHLYRNATLRETGKVGVLYDSYIIAMRVVPVFAVIGLLLGVR